MPNNNDPIYPTNERPLVTHEERIADALERIAARLEGEYVKAPSLAVEGWKARAEAAEQVLSTIRDAMPADLVANRATTHAVMQLVERASGTCRGCKGNDDRRKAEARARAAEEQLTRLRANVHEARKALPEDWQIPAQSLDLKGCVLGLAEERDECAKRLEDTRFAVEQLKAESKERGRLYVAESERARKAEAEAREARDELAAACLALPPEWSPDDRMKPLALSVRRLVIERGNMLKSLDAIGLAAGEGRFPREQRGQEGT